MNKFIDSDVFSKNKVVINQVELEEVLHKRVVEQGIKIEDLFLVVNGGDHEWSMKIDTKYGKLLTFAVRDCPKYLLLHHKKYNYPKINKVSTRALQSIDDSPSHLIN